MNVGTKLQIKAGMSVYAVRLPDGVDLEMMLLVSALILMFLSGVFEPAWMIPAVLRGIAMIFPVGYVADAMRSMWYGLDFVGGTTSGDSLTGRSRWRSWHSSWARLVDRAGVGSSVLDRGYSFFPVGFT